MRESQALSVPTLCALGSALVYLAFLPAAIYAIDGKSMLEVSLSLFTRHDVTVSSVGMGAVGRGGAYYSIWYPLLSVLALPAVAVGVTVGRTLGLPEYYAAAMCALSLTSVVSAVTTYFVAALALRLGATGRGAALAAVAFSFGTIAMVYSRGFFADPLLAMLTIAGIHFAFGNSRRSLLATVAVSCLAILAKPTGIVLGPCLSVYWLSTNRRTAEWLAPVFGTAVGFCAYAWYNWLRFADPLNFGQPQAFSLAAFPTALFGLLLSPGRGLLWYCPVVIPVMALPSRFLKQRECALILGIAAGYLAEHSFWSFWSGGWSWGPRLLLPALPGVLALTGLVAPRGKRLLIALALAGFVVNAPNLIAFYERYYQEANEAGLSESARIWNVRDAPLLRIWGSAGREVADAYANKDRIRSFVFEAGRSPLANDIESSRLLRIVNLWWWLLPAVRIPHAVGMIISALLAAAGVELLRRALGATAAEGNGREPHGSLDTPVVVPGT